MPAKQVEVSIQKLFEIVKKIDSFKLQLKVPEGVDADHFLFVREAVGLSEGIFSASSADSIAILKAVTAQIESVADIMAEYGIPPDSRFVALDEGGRRISPDQVASALARMRGEGQTPKTTDKGPMGTWKECEGCPSKDSCLDLDPRNDAKRSGKVENGKLR